MSGYRFQKAVLFSLAAALVPLVSLAQFRKPEPPGLPETLSVWQIIHGVFVWLTQSFSAFGLVALFLLSLVGLLFQKRRAICLKLAKLLAWPLMVFTGMLSGYLVYPFEYTKVEIFEYSAWFISLTLFLISLTLLHLKRSVDPKKVFITILTILVSVVSAVIWNFSR